MKNSEHDALAASYLEGLASKKLAKADINHRFADELRQDALTLQNVASDIRAGLHRPDPKKPRHA